MGRTFVVGVQWLALSALVVGCASYSKTCSDGVCKIVEDGKVRYEGDPDKIAKIKAAENKQHAKKEALLKKIAKAERKPKGEKIRLLIMPSYVSEQMKPYADQYMKMLAARLQKYSRLELVNYKQVNKVMMSNGMRMAMNDPDTWNNSGPNLESRNKKQPTPKEFAEQVQLLGGPADVIAYIGIGVHMKSGLVGGKGGAGVAQVDLPDLSAGVTSVYRFRKHNKSVKGKSITSFAVAGVNKKGKASSGQIKGAQRNLKSDAPAVKKLAKFIAKKSYKLRKTMPSMAALEKIHGPTSRKPTSKGNSKDALVNGLKGLFGSN